MGKFKKGDFVRRTAGTSFTTSTGRHEAGFVGQIADIVKNGTTDIIFTNGHAGIIDNYEPWQPRVGERVRVSSAKLSHNSVLIGREFKVTHQAYVLGDGAQTWGGDNAGGYVWRADELEPILSIAAPEQTATLKIEEGKLYKTRDGRKVGPMVVAQGRGKPWPWKSRYGLNIYYFKEDGFSCPGSAHLHRDTDDIIAEWVDEPATAKPSNDNAQPKFKVGDHVVCPMGCGLATVTTVRADGKFLVKWDDGQVGDVWWGDDDFDLVAVNTTTAIVALIENGQPKPSSTPHVHGSTGAAEKEANRLAAKFKGKQFGVFTLTTTHEEAAPAYDHKWQNMAALGLKIDAIKELRSITGMGLKPAKDAVEYFLAAA